MSKSSKSAAAGGAVDPVCVVVGDTPTDFPVPKGALALLDPAVAKALLKSGGAVRVATDRDRAIFVQPPVEATGWAPPASPASAD